MKTGMYWLRRSEKCINKTQEIVSCR